MSIPIIASNRINSPEIAEEVLSKIVQIWFLWLDHFWQTDFVRKAFENRSNEIVPCIACNQACLDHTFSMKLTSCLVNPRACRETELNYEKVILPKRIAVVGAGPAGISFSIVAAQRGHEVSLFDENHEIGGQLNFAKMIPGKEEFYGLLDFYKNEIKRLKINLVKHHKVEFSELKEFDEVVLATGVLPRKVNIKGQDDVNFVYDYQEVFNSGVSLGNKIAIIGAGGIGFDMAEYISSSGISPTLNINKWMEKWGVVDPEKERGGVLPKSEITLNTTSKEIFLLQRKNEKIGKRLGKTTGWIHRKSLEKRMLKCLQV